MGGENDSQSNLIVNSISKHLSDQQLREMFENVGQVHSAQIMKDHNTGQSLGYAYVNMRNASDAKMAIDTLNGSEVMQLKLKVNYANQRKDIATNKGGTPIFVQKLPPATTCEKLRELFGEFGEITEVQLPLKNTAAAATNATDDEQPPPPVCKGYAFLTYAEELDAKASIEALNAYKDDFFLQPLVVKISMSDEIIQAEKKKIARLEQSGNRFTPMRNTMHQSMSMDHNIPPPPPPPRRRKMTEPMKPAVTSIPKKMILPEVPPNSDGVTLFFYNIGKDTDESQMRRVLLSQGAGPTLYIAVVRDPTTLISKNFAFVKFRNPEDAQATIATLARTDLFGCGPVDIKYKTYNK